MAYAKVDPQVLGYLGRALSLEMSAVQQYLSVANVLKLRGFEEISEKFKHEAHEEMEHAERIISRMLVLGAAPNATHLRPAKLGNSLPEVISSAHSLEVEIVKFYQQAVDYCSQTDDFDSRLFFDQLLQEERQHATDLSDWYKNSLVPKTPKKINSGA